MDLVQDARLGCNAKRPATFQDSGEAVTSHGTPSAPPCSTTRWCACASTKGLRSTRASTTSTASPASSAPWSSIATPIRGSRRARRLTSCSGAWSTRCAGTSGRTTRRSEFHARPISSGSCRPPAGFCHLSAEGRPTIVEFTFHQPSLDTQRLRGWRSRRKKTQKKYRNSL